MNSLDNNLAEIKQAYEYCRKITKTHAKSFYFAAKFLPKHKQKVVYPIYAFCRHIDDEIDEIGERSESEAIRTVENWKQKLEKVYEGREELERTREAPKRETINQNLVLTAWKDLLKVYKIPPNLPLELMQGVLMDTQINRYETFDELYVYCYRVASTVGLMSSEILGYSDKKALKYAEAMGVAMQLTNILRDVKQDLAMNRIYLPQEDLQTFGVTEKQLFDNEINGNFVDLMRFQIARARDFYQIGENGISLLEQDSRFTVLLASRIYSRILDEIEGHNYDIFSRRASTTLTQKIISLPKIWRAARNL